MLTRIDPLTYIVDPMRHAVFDHLPVSPLALNVLSPGVTSAGWLVPLGLSLAIVATMGLAMLGIAIAELGKQTIAHCIRCGGIRHPLISKHLLIVSQVFARLYNEK